MAVARRLCLCTMWKPRVTRGKEWTNRLQGMQVGDDRHRRNHLPGQPSTADGLVPGDVVGDPSENGAQRPGIAAIAGLGQLPHGLDDVAQAAQCDGQAGEGPADRHHGSR